MDLFKFGLINILGIIAPGALLVAGLMLSTVGVFEFYHMTNYRPLLKIMGESQFVTIVLFLLASYLLGSTIRLLANDVTEIVSGWYLRKLRRRHSEIATQRFPYPIVSSWIAQNVDPKIVDRLRAANKDFDKERNKAFYNYCKMQIHSTSNARAVYCERIESYVRFLAGSFISSLITLSLTAVLCLLFCCSGRWDRAFGFGSVFFGMLMVCVVILERFRSQHTREVFYTWIAFYECSKSNSSC